MTGTIMSVTIPKQESKSAVVTVEIPRGEEDGKYCFYWDGPKYETAFVLRSSFENHPELYAVGSKCNVRYSKRDDGGWFLNIYF